MTASGTVPTADGTTPRQRWLIVRVTAQMLFDLILLGFGARVFLGAEGMRDG
jgi:hypothetical protein